MFIKEIEKKTKISQLKREKSLKRGGINRENITAMDRANEFAKMSKKT